MEWLEITGTSVEVAKEQALIHLGVHESDAEFEVISAGKTGLFGRMKEEARVRARVVPTPARSKENRSRGGASRKSGSKRGSTAQRANPAVTETGKDTPSQHASPRTRRSSRAVTKNAPTKSVVEGKSEHKGSGKEIEMDSSYSGPSLLEQADIAEDFVMGIADALGVSVSFARDDLADGIMRIEVRGEGMGLLVGRRGTTAQAIDELVRTVLQRSGGTIREGKIRMDVAGVRARRAASLAEFARSIAQQVSESGEAVALEPMSRLDRKIVHDVIAEFSEVGSRSEGEDPNRRVVVAPTVD